MLDSSSDALTGHIQAPNNRTDNPAETLPVLIAGSPLVPVLIARGRTPARSWLALLRLIERSGGYSSAVASNQPPLIRCLAWVADAHRSLRHIENWTPQRVGTDIVLSTVAEADRHVRTLGPCLVAVVPVKGTVYMVEGDSSAVTMQTPARSNQQAPTHSTPPQYAWTHFTRCLLDGVPSQQPASIVQPVGWGDSRFSTGFTRSIPFPTVPSTKPKPDPA